MFYNADGGLTTAGYVLTAVAVFALLILISTLAGKKKTVNAKQLAFAAGALALAIVTSYIKLFHLPMGGSVTLFSMFFVTLIGYWYGPTVGIMAGVAYGLLQMILDPYIISLPQMLIDYPFAFGALGLSGLFSEKKNGMIIGYIVSVFGRFVFAVLSGVIFFGMYAP
ncbi:MAG: energy-coupled thiamine transporter ThiT, partial [Succinimonas sp.]|nr:energy-coupled thiamine transporter ThiT [Succinimonas sp.]